ncbi:BnaA05g27960D [Brassica napus]|uniref:BnaA05g27960D protein n=1 Tax=Brassica napus TaxID=3708 RepID=A0A078F290_BRANA|nr:BnaA05g27960D [Brassica napus]
MKKCQYAVSGKLQKEGKKVYTFGSSCAFTCWLYSRKRDSQKDGIIEWRKMSVFQRISGGSWAVPSFQIWARIRHYIMILLSVSVYINSSIFQKHSMTSLRVASTPADE